MSQSQPEAESLHESVLCSPASFQNPEAVHLRQQHARYLLWPRVVDPTPVFSPDELGRPLVPSFLIDLSLYVHLSLRRNILRLPVGHCLGDHVPLLLCADNTRRFCVVRVASNQSFPASPLQSAWDR